MRLNVGQRLSKVVVVVVDPLVQDLAHSQPADLRMRAGSLELLGQEGSDELNALASQGLELREQLIWLAFAVAPRFGHPNLVPGLEVGAFGAEHDPDPARKSTLLGLDHVADAFIHAPLTVSGTPRRGLWRQSVEQTRERVTGHV